MTHPRLCAVSIDLDPIACYYRIHGLGAAPPELTHTIYRRALPRAAELFARRGLRVTWFVVGKDVDAEIAMSDRDVRAANAERLRALAEQGDELANHSYSHPYELTRMSPDEIDREIADADRILRTIAGGPPRGFRAPGYNISAAVFDALARRGYRYDSSVFPAPGYYAGKAFVMGALALVRRPSGAVLTDPRALIAPADPYRPAMAAPWRRGQAPLVELPIAVTPWSRVPAIGTSLVLAPGWVRKRVLRAMADRWMFNLELHGIDFCDPDSDGIPGELIARQADLRVPLADKLARIDQILDAIARDRELVTLAGVAAHVQRTH